MTLPVTVIACISLAFGFSADAGETSGDIKKRLIEICRTTFDGPSANIDRELLLRQRVEDLGEEGRKVMLSLAESKEPDAGCAFRKLLDLKDPRVIPLIRKVLNSPGATIDMKTKALQGVGVFRDAASFDRVLEAFRSGNKDLVRASAFALASLADERGLVALREAMASSTSQKFKWDIARVIGVPGHEKAVEPLVQLLKEPEVAQYESLRGDVVLGLASIGGPHGRPAALAELEGYKKADYRQEIAWKVFGIFFEQRKLTTDPVEVSEIEDAMVKARALAEKREN